MCTRFSMACARHVHVRLPGAYGMCTSASQEHGARLYNNAIMMLPLASLPMRANAAFAASAKLGTCHQHVLVFWNGKAPNRDVKTIGLHNASRPLEWF